MTISAGAMVTCRQTGSILYVVVGQADDGVRWKLRSKRIDHRGRTDSNGRIAGAADITVIREAPSYAPHSMIEHNGRYHEIAADHGDTVELIVPEHSRPLADRESALQYEAGQRITVEKGELTLNLFIAKARAQ